jgi:hypothetical protein|nr:MAG TPA: hypothetical protein [Caudoviricetes sp.]
MSTARQSYRAAETFPEPTVTRTSIFPKGACPAPTTVFPAVFHTALPAAGPDWRDQARTEELPATAARRRHTPVRRHLRCALTGTLLAIVAITGLSAYATQSIADARQNALCQARITCK